MQGKHTTMTAPSLSEMKSLAIGSSIVMSPSKVVPPSLLISVIDQERHSRTEEPDVHIGGVLLLNEVDKDGLGAMSRKRQRLMDAHWSPCTASRHQDSESSLGRFAAPASGETGRRHCKPRGDGRFRTRRWRMIS
jgi:hypothetical protein